jgi:putative NADPH-quinone reductase
MRALVIYCHPNPHSFTAAIRDVVMQRLSAAGVKTRLCDLYAQGFDPVLDANDLGVYADPARNQAATQRHCDDLAWCDTLIFIYPTWWYGLPAMIKGWLDRVLVPGLAFHLPDQPAAPIRPGLRHVKRLGVFTTCGAGFWMMRLIGAPGRRQLMRGIGLLCAPQCRKIFAAHYRMDRSTPASRARHLRRVAARIDRLMR